MHSHAERGNEKWVDAAIIDEQNQRPSPWSESPQIICEKIMYSLSAHLENNGYSAIWERNA